MDLYDLLPTASSCSGGDSQSVSLNTRKVARWIPSRHSAEKLSAGLLYSDQIEDAFIFLCLVEGKTYAFSAECMVNHELMFGAQIDGYTLVCPHHQGCLYDIRNGARLGSDAYLGCYPVKKEAQRILIGLDMPFIPELPSFWKFAVVKQHQLLVAGAGNMLNSDDAFGPLVIQGYEQKHCRQPGLKLMETGIGGINIIQEMLLGYEGLILVDAFEERLPPG